MCARTYEILFVSVYIYMYMYVYIHTCVCIYIHTHRPTWPSWYGHVNMSVCAHACMILLYGLFFYVCTMRARFKAGQYGVASNCRLLKIIGLLCKRAL